MTKQGSVGITRRPSQAMALLVICSCLIFGLINVGYLIRVLDGTRLPPFAFALLIFKTAVEIGVSLYFFSSLFSAIAYLTKREITPEPLQDTERKFQALSPYPPVGIIYLCCNDLDLSALESLVKLRYQGELHLIIHDDSRSPEAQFAVDAAVEQLRQDGSCDIRLLRRPQKEGGKAGAVNYILEQTGHLYEYFLLCDNDSIALDPLTIEKALPYFEDERVAIVQCRSVAAENPDYCSVNQLLSQSISAFHVFLSTWSRFGWRPFIGHNALLRTSTVLEVEGLTPGFFSDDIDLTVRLNLRGYSVVYAPEIHIGEKHPPSYTAYRKRSYKWAYGCVQSLKAHAWSVLTSRRLSVAEKFSFFQFIGFYMGQSILLLYLAINSFVVPFVLNRYQANVTASVIMGTILIFPVYLPMMSYFIKERKLIGSVGSVVMCGLVYGATDFACARGVWDCLWNRERQWIPTNSSSQEQNSFALFGEALFGIMLLCVPLLVFPAMLYLPCSYLYAGKFFFGPTLSILYDDQRAQSVQPKVRSKPGALRALTNLITSRQRYQE